MYIVYYMLYILYYILYIIYYRLYIIYIVYVIHIIYSMKWWQSPPRQLTLSCNKSTTCSVKKLPLAISRSKATRQGIYDRRCI